MPTLAPDLGSRHPPRSTASASTVSRPAPAPGKHPSYLAAPHYAPPPPAHSRAYRPRGAAYARALCSCGRHTRCCPAAPLFRGPYRLAVDDPHRGFRLPAQRDPHAQVQGFVQPLQGSIVLPPHKPAEHRAIRREVLGQEAPGATRAVQIEQRVEDLSQRIFALASAGMFRGQEAFNLLPLRVRQIRPVATALPGSALPIVLLTYS